MLDFGILMFLGTYSNESYQNLALFSSVHRLFNNGSKIQSKYVSQPMPCAVS